MAVQGNELLAQSLKARGVEVIFFIMGGPLIDCANACAEAGIRMVDVRHEQAAAMMAHAYSRLTNTPSVCMGASGPGTANLGTGLMNAFVDRAPVIAIGGAADMRSVGRGSFQEVDQWGMLRPVVRWSERIYDTRRIPELVETAFRRATAQGTGPVYLDVPADVLYGEVEEDAIAHVAPSDLPARPQADPAQVARTIELLAQAERPVAISGSGLFWSDAVAEYRDWIAATGIPFFTTPHGRGAVPEDDPLMFHHMRSHAFKNADVVMVVGTRLNYVIDYAGPPRFDPAAKLIQIDVDEAEIGRTRRADAPLLGDARAVLRQLLDARDERVAPARWSGWVETLRAGNAEKAARRDPAMDTDQVPIHPLRLCKEVRDWMDRDAILCVDGQEILNYGRQTLPTYEPRHRLNSGPLGTMGVGLPFGLGAKVARPEKQVVVVHGDGSLGLNAMELDTAVRHGLPVIVVVSNNGGWTAANRFKAGRDLGDTPFHRLAEALGCHGEHVDRPEDLRPALERAAAAVAEGRPAVVDVATDPMARAGTVAFTSTMT